MMINQLRNMFQKKLVFLILVLVLIAVAGGVSIWLYSSRSGSAVPQQGVRDLTSSVPSLENEVSDWKTYTNQRYKFSFKYPANATFAPGIIDPEEADDPVVEFPESTPPALFYVQVIDPRVHTGAGAVAELKMSLREWANTVLQLSLGRNYTVESMQPVVVGGREAYRLEVRGGVTTPARGMVFDNVPYSVILLSSDIRKFFIWFPQGERKSEQILQTFTFLE